MKKLIKVLSYLIAAGAIICMVTGINIKAFGKNSKPVKADCIIVLGCQVYGTTPSPFLKGRLNEGIRLYNEGYAKYIIVTGGKGSGEDISEAEAMKIYLIANGVDESSIIMEDKSMSTMQNLKNSKEIMNSKGFKRAIIVSNEYHLKRTSIMAKRNKIEASYSGVYISKYPSFELKGFLREIPALLRLYILGR